MPRPMGIFKTENDYQKLIDSSLYQKTPKAVFAAIVVSLFLNHQNVNAEKVNEIFIAEWETLHKQGLIPQKPPKLK